MKLIDTPILFPACIALFLLSSCSKNNTIDDGYKDGLTTEIADTINVVASTYQLDSLPTSNTGVILTGQADDPALGKTKISSFFQLKPASVSVPANSTFDSLTLVLKYNKYTYGDTTMIKNIDVHRVTQQIILRKPSAGTEPEERPVFVDGEALYSTSNFSYEPQVLGSINFKPRPSTRDSLSINLNKDLGKEIFTLIQNKDKKVTEDSKFLEYFRGLALTSSAGGSIDGFNADSVKMYVHYHYQNDAGFATKGRTAFIMNDKKYQFNHIDADRSKTSLKDLAYKNKEILSANTNQEVFLQAGTGVVTKIKLPGLATFMREAKVIVNKVELVIETKPATYATFSPPAALILFIANNSNIPKSILTDPYKKTTQQGNFRQGSTESGLNGSYTFLLTEYADKLKKGEYDNTSLLLSLPVSELMKSLNRLQITNYKSSVSIKTRVTYTKY